MGQSADSLVKDIADLVAMPEVYIRLRALINDPNSTINDYVCAVSDDPALSTRVIKIANSVFFGHSRKVESLERAISFIGVIQLHDLLLGTLAMRCFSEIPNEVVNLLDFWKTSVHCGIISRILAKQCALPAPERLFAYGLLQDIGHVVIYLKAPELAQETVIRATERSIPIHLVERDLFGFDYGQVGSALMRLWHLPDSYRQTTEHQPEPQKTEQFRIETAIVHLARNMASIDEFSTNPAYDRLTVDPIVWKLTQLSQSLIDEVSKKAYQHISEVMKMLLPNPQLANFNTLDRYQ